MFIFLAIYSSIITILLTLVVIYSVVVTTRALGFQSNMDIYIDLIDQNREKLIVCYKEVDNLAKTDVMLDTPEIRMLLKNIQLTSKIMEDFIIILQNSQDIEKESNSKST